MPSNEIRPPTNGRQRLTARMRLDDLAAITDEIWGVLLHLTEEDWDAGHIVVHQ